MVVVMRAVQRATTRSTRRSHATPSRFYRLQSRRPVLWATICSEMRLPLCARRVWVAPTAVAVVVAVAVAVEVAVAVAVAAAVGLPPAAPSKPLTAALRRAFRPARF